MIGLLSTKLRGHVQAAFKLYCQTGHSVDAIVGKWQKDYINVYDEKMISKEEVDRREEMVKKGTKLASIPCMNGNACYKAECGYLHGIKQGEEVVGV